MVPIRRLTAAAGHRAGAGIKSFAAGHGGAKAVIEYVGKRGARIVLVGEDGEWGDQFADGTDVAREACEKAGVDGRERLGARADGADAPEQRPLAVDGAADAWPADPAQMTRPIIASATRGHPGSLSSPAPTFPTSTPTTGCCSTPLARPGVAVDAVRLGRPASTGPRTTWSVLRSTVGLRAAPRRVRRLGAPRARGWPTRPTWSRWNTDKRYLGELAAAGRARRADRLVRAGRRVDRPPPAGEWVVKPAVSAGSQDTGRYDLADPEHRALAAAHVRRLPAAGRMAMVQPYLTRRRHRRRDRAALPGRGRTAHVQPRDPQGPDAHRPGHSAATGCYRPRRSPPRTPRAAELAVADRALAAVPAAPSGCSTPGST